MITLWRKGAVFPKIDSHYIALTALELGLELKEILLSPPTMKTAQKVTVLWVQAVHAGSGRL